MKNLYLLRHAKSSWKDIGQADRDRELSNRGLEDAPAMGRRCHDRGETIDRVVTSPARRASHTAELFCRASAIDPAAIHADDKLYFLGHGSIEAVIHEQPDAAENLLLVFHNPDITGFANRIDEAFRIDNVPTCGLIRVDCDIDRWRDWSPGVCRFGYFDFPKNQAADPITP